MPLYANQEERDFALQNVATELKSLREAFDARERKFEMTFERMSWMFGAAPGDEGEHGRLVARVKALENPIWSDSKKWVGVIVGGLISVIVVGSLTWVVADMRQRDRQDLIQQQQAHQIEALTGDKSPFVSKDHFDQAMIAWHTDIDAWKKQYESRLKAQ